MADIIQMRRDIEQNWLLANPVLSDGELSFTTDTIPKKIKMGNGVNRWADLQYLAGLASTIVIGTVTTGNAGTTASVVNVGTETDAILNFTIPRGESGTGTGDMSKTVYDINNNGIVDLAENVTKTSDIFIQKDNKTAMIPIGWLYDVFRADRSRTYDFLWIDCQDINGSPQNPTSFILTMYVNNVLVYTSPSITTSAFTTTINQLISAGDLVRVNLSNTTGLTGSVIVSLRMVNR